MVKPSCRARPSRRASTQSKMQRSPWAGQATSAACCGAASGILAMQGLWGLLHATCRLLGVPQAGVNPLLLPLNIHALNGNLWGYALQRKAIPVLEIIFGAFMSCATSCRAVPQETC